MQSCHLIRLKIDRTHQVDVLFSAFFNKFMGLCLEKEADWTKGLPALCELFIPKASQSVRSEGSRDRF